MKSNINVSNLTSVYNIYNSSFNTTLRFIIETAAADRVAVPATPTKDMGDDEARARRVEIRRAKNANRAIDDCARICAALEITAASLKKAPAKALREAVLARLPYVAAVTGHAVVKCNLPTYLTDEYEGVFGVRAASWLEAFAAAAENTDGTRREYELTAAPLIEEGNLTEAARGAVVDANMNVVANADAVLATWSRLAPINSAAGKVGREAKSAYFQANKSPLAGI